MSKFKPVPEQLELIKRGAVEVISEEELTAKLEVSRKEDKPLVIKAGFDPTAPDIHLGHTVLLRKMKQFSELGHDVVFLIGDFTGMIGDPTGKSEIRKQLTREQVMQNARTYEQQIAKVFQGAKYRRVFNSEWFIKKTPQDFLRLTSHLTVAQMLARDDFKQRYTAGKDISILEFIYPLLQGYDSVELKADLELGGTDQKFNLLVGRQLQKDFGQRTQCVLMMPLLEGLDGVQKMSKSLNNYVGINESAEDMFGKIMSISDDLMFRYYELLTDVSLSDIRNMKKNVSEGKLHPKEAKERLARDIIEYYYSAADAENASKVFASRFSGGTTDWDNPDNFEIRKISRSEWKDGKLWICRLLTLSHAVKSNSDARRLIQQKAVMLDAAVLEDANLELPLPRDRYLLKVGKKQFLQIVVDE